MFYVFSVLNYIFFLPNTWFPFVFYVQFSGAVMNF